jgi:hypothetical protein
MSIAHIIIGSVIGGLLYKYLKNLLTNKNK